MKFQPIRIGFGAVLLFGAVVFGMVVAGSLDLTPLTFGMGSEPEQKVERFADPVAVSANTQIASFADLAEAVLPAVVTVSSTTIQTEAGDGGIDFFRMMPRRGGGDEPRERRSLGVGSGFIVSADGWLVTNNHVIDGASKVEVLLGKTTFIAEVKGVDPSTDIAVLKIDAVDLPYLDIGDSDQLRVGDWVMAVGSPLGIGTSVTVGVVSAKGRVLGITGDRAFDDFIQTDAAINRGNSGGPLLNTRGQVIGVSTAMNFAAENIGFAVSSKVLLDVVPQLRGEGRVSRGYLGVAIRDLDEDLVEATPGVSSTHGALITAIQAQPARKAGLEAGDVVLSVDGREITDVAELISNVSRRKPGDTITLDVVRHGKTLKKTVVLGDRQESIGMSPPKVEVEAKPTRLEWLDVEVRDLDDSLRSEINLEPSVTGVLLAVIGANSPLAEKGVLDYDIVREVNQVPVDSVEAFKDQVAKIKSGGTLLLFIHSPARGGFQDFVVVRVP